MHNLSMMGKGTQAAILELAREQGIVTPADVRALGLTPENLNDLVRRGLLVRAGRGIYEHPEFEWTESHSYVEVAKAIPDAVMCLLTALRIHEIGTQVPHEVWIAIPRGKRVPVARSARLRAITMMEPAYSLGVQTVMMEGVGVRVTSPAKTVVDCFRLRRLIGHDVAVEALKEGLRSRIVHADELQSMATTLRAWTTIRPYLEALQG